MTVPSWKQDWTAAQAIAMLCLERSVYKNSARNLPTRIVTVLTDAMAGRLARLNADEELGGNRSNLAKAVHQVKLHMATMKITGDRKMPPALWIRLLHDAKVPIAMGVIRRFGEWRLKTEVEGALVYEAVSASPTSEPVSKLLLRGVTNQEVRAWTVEELLLHQVEKDSAWPFSSSWRCRLVKREDANSSAPVAKKEVQEAATQAITPKKRRRKTMTRKDYQAACGSGVMENLLNALRSEQQSGRGHLEKVKEGRYTTSLPSAELIAKLKAHQGKILTGADSTLRKALGAYVTLPRGRPEKKKPKKRQPR